MDLTASDRSALIRLASSLPQGSEERKTLLAQLKESAADPVYLEKPHDYLGAIQKRFRKENAKYQGGKVTDQMWLNGWHSGVDIQWGEHQDWILVSRVGWEIAGAGKVDKGDTDFATFFVGPDDGDDYERGFNGLDQGDESEDSGSVTSDDVVARGRSLGADAHGGGIITLTALDMRKRVAATGDFEDDFDQYELLVKQYVRKVLPKLKSAYKEWF